MMANTFTCTTEGIMGNLRVRIGTLTLTDGAGDGSTTHLATTGMNNIVFAAENSATPCRLTYSGGYLGASSAGTGASLGSGAAMQVIIFGA